MTAPHGICFPCEPDDVFTRSPTWDELESFFAAFVDETANDIDQTFGEVHALKRRDDDRWAMSLEEIGEVLGMTRTNVQRIERIALRKLRLARWRPEFKALWELHYL